MAAEFLADNGVCSGHVTFTLWVSGTGFERGWRAVDTTGRCPTSCYDMFDARLEKLP